MEDTKRREVVEQEVVRRKDPERTPTRFAVGTQRMHALSAQDLVETELAEIVHDLKSPLHAIALETAMLDDKLVRGDRLGGLRSIARINQNIAFLDRLILDLLDACSLANGSLQLYREPCDLRALLGQVIERLDVSSERAPALLDAPERIIVTADRFRIERVVANLLDNALKYTPASSSIVVRLARHGETACVSIIDSGPGIAGAELAYLFERYRRAETAQGRNGYGLGLYVCKKIIEAHGGKIGVESARGLGSRFYFELRES